MGLIEARNKLRVEVDRKLTEQKITGGGFEPEVLHIEYYRIAFLRDYTGISGYAGWLNARNTRIESEAKSLAYKLEPRGDEYKPEEEEGEEEVANKLIRLKLMKQPRKRELPKPLLAYSKRKLRETYSDQEDEDLDWKDVNLEAGALIVIYDIPDDLPSGRTMRRTHSLFLPGNSSNEAILIDHLAKPRGFKARLRSLNPFGRDFDRNGVSEIAKIEDIEAITRLVRSCGVYDHRNFIRKEEIPLS